METGTTPRQIPVNFNVIIRGLKIIRGKLTVTRRARLYARDFRIRRAASNRAAVSIVRDRDRDRGCKRQSALSGNIIRRRAIRARPGGRRERGRIRDLNI